MDSGKKSLNLCGPQIRRIRYQHGWSQAHLAATCQIAGWDISRDIVARIEACNRAVTDADLAVLAEVLGVSILALYPAATRTRLSKLTVLSIPRR